MALAFVATAVGSVDAADDDAKYRTYAADIRKEVYAMDMPEFANRTVPESLKNESAVVLASYRGLNAGKQTRFTGWALLGYGLDHNLVVTYLTRDLIHIGDEAALKEFSEYEFSTHDKNWTSYGKDRQQRVLGVRVFKKNGETVDVETDDFIIESEGETGEEKTHKLAVPNLEVGDDIDIFVHTSVRYENHNIAPVYFVFQSDYPMLSYRVKCEMDRKLATFYRSYNGAPRFTETKNAENDFTLEAKAENIDRFPGGWYDVGAHSPYIMMQFYNTKAPSYVPSYAERGVNYVTDDSEIRDEAKKLSEPLRYKGSFCGIYKSDLKAIAKDKSIGTEEKVEKIYNAVFLTYLFGRTEWINNYVTFDMRAFMMGFSTWLKRAKIKNEIFLTTEKGDEAIDELCSNYNAEVGIFIPETGKYYLRPRTLMVPGDVQNQFAGRKALIIEKKGYREVTLPSGSAEQNVDKNEISASFDGTRLNISRHAELSGTSKARFQNWLPTEEDIDTELRKFIGTKKTRKDELSKRYVESHEEQWRKAREKQRDNFKEEVEDYHGDAPSEFKGYKLVSLGYSSKQPNMVYEVDYAMDGYVKKAGKNIIVSIGKLARWQTKVAEEDRTRKEDVDYRPRTYSYTIRLKLPTGYNVQAESLKKLNSSVDNECVAFVTNGKVEAGELIVTVNQVFKNAHEPASNWGKILDALDAAKRFADVQVIVSK